MPHKYHQDKEDREHESRGSKKHHESKTSREKESRGMKKAMDKGHSAHSKHHAHIHKHMEKIKGYLSKMSEAGHKEDSSAKHHRAESRGMKKAMDHKDRR